MDVEKFSLDGKAAIVTGGARGLGAAYAEGLAKAGADLLLLDKLADKQRETAERISDFAEGKVVPMGGDVRSEVDVKEMVERADESFGKIDLVVNNAGVAQAKPAVDVTLEEWNEVIDTNLTGVFLCSREVGGYMIENGIEGDIINVSSGYGEIPDLLPLSSYYASKAGVINLSKALANEWGKHGVRVNVICPGWFPTEMTKSHMEKEKWKKHMDSKIALGRTGEMEDIVPLVLFMASDLSNYISGHVFEATGGPVETSETMDTGVRYLEEDIENGEKFLELFDFADD